MEPPYSSRYDVFRPHIGADSRQGDEYEDQRFPISTIQNLDAAFAGESMAHIKYKFFAEVCRRYGGEETARIFEATAAQELQHAFGHMDLLFSKVNSIRPIASNLPFRARRTSTLKCIHASATLPSRSATMRRVREFDEQIEESKQHAERFRTARELAVKRFAALTKVEQRHADRYTETLKRVTAG